MELFLTLYLGHVLGDFLLQPGRLVVAKRDGVPGLVIHTLVVGASTLAVVAGTIEIDWAPAALVTGLHLVIERVTIVTYTRTRTRGLFTFLMDQALHALSIALIVWLTGRWSISGTADLFGMPIPTIDLAVLCGLATVTLFGSILVFECVNALLGEEKGRILRLDAARMGGYLERGSSFLAALISPPLGLVPFLPRLVRAFTGPAERRDRLLVEAASGMLLVTLAVASVAAVAWLTQGTLSGMAHWLSALLP